MRILAFLLSLCLFFHLEAAPRKKSGYKRPAYLTKTRPVIVLDAGHGGRDGGAKDRSPYIEEKKITLQTALLVKKYLSYLGYKVVMTRQHDVFIPLSRRIRFAHPTRTSIL